MAFLKSKCLLLVFVILLCCMTTALHAQTADSTVMVNPTIGSKAIRGLIHTNSAETVGEGRLSFSVLGSYYKQKTGYDLTPNTNAKIFVGSGAFSFGVNSYIDVFAALNAFGSQDYAVDKASGIGSVQAGIQGALPLPKGSPFVLAAQLSLIGGTSENQLNSHLSDGYNYFETRTGYDYMGKLLQSMVFGSEKQSFKIHLNEGAVYSLEKDKKLVMLLAMGLQANIMPLLVLGVEANSRTFFEDIEIKSDPLWITPTIQFRTPYYFNVILGGDISVSKDRENVQQVKSLEQYRLFAALDFTMDLLEGKRKATAQEEANKEKLLAAEKAAQLQKQQQLAFANDSLMKKMKQDSLIAVQKQKESQLRADSLLQKMKQDSISLVETKARLREEMSKRSDVEKKLLSTGLLILDAVYFESGKTEISINSKPYLNIIGKMLLKYGKMRLEVGGHTDNIGGMESNKRLSAARAESVRQYLVLVAPDLYPRLTAVGYGSDMPKADNRSAAGRKVNRRVEIVVLNKDVLKEYNP